MAKPDSNTQTFADVAIIGGGIVGLWCAVKAARQGLRTHLIEAKTIGSGASGGFLGALMPHQPTNWTEKKQLQRDALLSLESEIDDLQNTTGIDCGYLRCGRLMPIRTSEKLEQSKAYQTASKNFWPKHSPLGHQITWSITEPDSHPEWLDPNLANLACDHETFSARVNPRALLQALAKQARMDGVVIQNQCQILKIDADGSVHTRSGTRVSVGHVIVAAGWQSFALCAPLAGFCLGTGVKGQAALLKPNVPINTKLPIIYDGGIYIIAHDDGSIAVGSTSETEFDEPSRVDDLLTGLLNSAKTLCPALLDAKILKTWASVRPKAIGREPVIGRLPGADKIILASGGFKISFGIAHVLAAAAIGTITGTSVKLPSKFRITHHMAEAERKAMKNEGAHARS